MSGSACSTLPACASNCASSTRTSGSPRAQRHGALQGFLGERGLVIGEVRARQRAQYRHGFRLIAQHRAQVADGGRRIVALHREISAQQQRIVVARILGQHFLHQLQRLVVLAFGGVHRRDAIARDQALRLGSRARDDFLVHRDGLARSCRCAAASAPRPSRRS